MIPETAEDLKLSYRGMGEGSLKMSKWGGLRWIMFQAEIFAKPK